VSNSVSRARAHASSSKKSSPTPISYRMSVTVFVTDRATPSTTLRPNRTVPATTRTRKLGEWSRRGRSRRFERELRRLWAREMLGCFWFPESVRLAPGLGNASDETRAPFADETRRLARAVPSACSSAWMSSRSFFRETASSASMVAGISKRFAEYRVLI